MSVLVDIVNAVVDVGQQVSDFIYSGFYSMLTKFTAWFIKWAVVAMWKAKLAALVFSWDVAQEIITSLNISSYLNTAFSMLESRTLAFVVYLRIPEAINLIISASVTRFVFKFLGF